MASFLPKKKYLSQLGQDAPTNLINYNSVTSSLADDVSGVASCQLPSPPSLASSSRVSSFLLLSDSQRNLSDGELKLLGSPLFLGSLCSERFGSGISLDTLERICSDQENYNSENGENIAMVSSNYQRSLFQPVSSSSGLIANDFNAEDLALLVSGSSLSKSGVGAEEQRTSDPGQDTTEIAQDAILPSLPSLSSFSSLSEIELNAHPSSGSFSSILNSLDANERGSPPVGSLMRNLLTGSEDPDRSAGISDSLLNYDSKFTKTLSSQSLLSLQHNALPNSTYRIKACDFVLDAQSDQSNASDKCCLQSSAADDPEMFIKEEVEEENMELKQVQVTTSGRNRGSGKSREPKYECQVCGDVAAGYHCGAYVCEACKKFYLRCLKTRGTPAFLCPKHNDCDITKDTRSHCQYCRFQKCISLGMYKPGHEDDKKLKINFKVIPCKVCSAPSSGFHFGAITCEGCKGFFRRMLKEQLHKKFVCVNDEPCNIDSANRTTCKCCRFEKCLQVGMTLEGTRLGRQSNSVKRRTLMQYVSSERHRSQNSSRNRDENSDDEMTNERTTADSQSAPDHVKEENDEDSFSEPLCINFPQIQDSEEKHASRSSLNSSAESASSMATESFRRRKFVTKADAKMAHGSTISSTNYGWKPNPCTVENIHNNTMAPLDKRKTDPADEGDTCDDGRLSSEQALQSKSFHLSKGEVLHSSTESSQYSYQNYDAPSNSMKIAQKGFSDRYSNWNGSASDWLQPGTDDIHKETVETPVINYKALQQHSVVAMNSYSDVCSMKSSMMGISEVQNCWSSDGLNRTSLPQQCVTNSREASVKADWPSNGGTATLHGNTCNITESVPHPLSCDGNVGLCESPQTLFGHLVCAYRELEEINRRPAELDELHFQPVSIQTIWKLVEIPFIHQSKIVLRFIKKVPGFRQLVVEDQIKIAQDSFYPIVLLYHSRSYNLKTGEFDWFISTPKERDLILSVLTPFRSMANHFRSIGHIVKWLNMTEEELAFIAAMSVLTASEGSPLQSGNRVSELQDDLVEAYVSYQLKGFGGSPSQKRIGELLARLPELKRANIEHRLIVAQVQQMIPEIEMSHLYQEIFLSS